MFSHQSSPSQTAHEPARKSTADQRDANQPCYTKKEVRDIIFERNELKTNLFLVQEELSYYQRWVHCVCVRVCEDLFCFAFLPRESLAEHVLKLHILAN